MAVERIREIRGALGDQGFLREGEAGPQSVGSGWDIPDEVSDAVDFHWFHPTPKCALVLCVLSGKPAWYVGHFDGGRMRRCARVLCSYCDRGVGTQLRFVFSVVELHTRQAGVIEVGKEHALMLKDVAARRGGLRGVVIEVTKASAAKQSRTVISVQDSLAPSWALAKEPHDLERVLAATWDRLA